MERGSAESVKAAFVVIGTVYNPGNLAPCECPGTHQARLDGDIQGAVGEVFTAQIVGSGSYGLHFGMCSNVDERLGEVMCASHNAVGTHHHGTYRHLALFGCLARLGKRLLHEIFVGMRHFGQRVSEW